MSQEERKVKEIWPRAHCIDVCYYGSHRKVIVTTTGFNLGMGKTPTEAWQSAASRLSEGEHE